MTYKLQLTRTNDPLTFQVRQVKVIKKTVKRY